MGADRRSRHAARLTTDGPESARIRSIIERPHARLGALAPEIAVAQSEGVHERLDAPVRRVCDLDDAPGRR
jgi:hypothetical protein